MTWKKLLLILIAIAITGYLFSFRETRSIAQNSCVVGDINGDGRASLADYEFFRRAFLGGANPSPTGSVVKIPNNPKIMPLGDSVTMGMHGPGADWNVNKSLRGGYRAKLYELLQANGTAFDFVGHGDLDVRETLPTAYQDHEGHGGWCITGGGGSCFGDSVAPGGNAGLLSHVEQWINTDHPDVILLHIGTNDFSGGDAVADAISRYGQLIDKITTVSPNIFLFVSNLHIEGNSNVNNTFNSQLQSLVQQKSQGGKKVFFVDTYKNMASPISEGGDTLHPSMANYEIMGTNWFNALKPYLGGGTSPGITQQPSGTNPVGPTGNFTLTFQDEFNSFNSANWTRTYPWDTSGAERRDTDAGTGQIINPANVQVSGGILKMLYKKIPPETINGITREWEGAIMHTRGKQTFSSSPNGTFVEVRAKSMVGSGFWSESWILPNDFANDPNCPVQRYTFKLFEVNGKYPQYTTFNMKKRGSCTVGDPNNLIDDAKTHQFTSNLSEAFHTYGMDWYPTKVDFYFDGQKVHTSTAISGNDFPGFMIFTAYVVTNVGLNGRNYFPYDGVPNAQTPTTAEYSYDYIRVWKRS